MPSCANNGYGNKRWNDTPFFAWTAGVIGEVKLFSQGGGEKGVGVALGRGISDNAGAELRLVCCKGLLR